MKKQEYQQFKETIKSELVMEVLNIIANKLILYPLDHESIDDDYRRGKADGLEIAWNIVNEYITKYITEHLW